MKVTNLVLTNNEEMVTVALATTGIEISFVSQDGRVFHIDYKGSELIKLQRELIDRIEMFANGEYTKFHKFTCLKFADEMKIKVHAGLRDVWDTYDGTGYLISMNNGEVAYKRFKHSNLKAALADLVLDAMNNGKVKGGIR